MKKLAPIPVKMTSVIARRDLVLASGGKRRKVRIRIGRPIQDVETAGGLDWRCPILVSGVGRSRMLRGLGVDSFQALVDGLKVVQTEITRMESRSPGRFEWLGYQWHGVPNIRLAMPPLKRRPL